MANGFIRPDWGREEYFTHSDGRYGNVRPPIIRIGLLLKFSKKYIPLIAPFDCQNVRFFLRHFKRHFSILVQYPKCWIRSLFAHYLSYHRGCPWPPLSWSSSTSPLITYKTPQYSHSSSSPLALLISSSADASDAADPWPRLNINDVIDGRAL